MPPELMSKRHLHAIAQILCFQEYGDWRYDPGKLQHRVWLRRAGQIIAHVVEVGS